MKYERLTPKDMVTVLNRNEQERLEPLLRYAYRLYELEDKIENGTLIELPIPLGTELHFLHSHEHADRPTSPTIHSSKEWTFEIWGNGKSGISCDDIPCGYYGVYHHQLGDTVFLTRAEAEKRLKELKGE